MFSALETGIGLDVVLFLQSMQNSGFDALASTLSFLGDSTFYLILLTLVYWSYHKRKGQHMVFVLLITLAITAALKVLLGMPRPVHVSGDVLPILEAGGYGFPSGHVSVSIAVWGYVALTFRRRWVTLFVIVYVLLQAWARMYGGVHYPQDVIGGAVLGLAVLAVFWRKQAAAYAWWDHLNLRSQLAISLMIAVGALVLTYPDSDGVAAAGVLFGGGLGLVLEQRAIQFSAQGALTRRVLRYVIGSILLVGIFYGMRSALDGLEPEQAIRFARYAIIGFLAMAAWPWLSMRVGLGEKL